MHISALPMEMLHRKDILQTVHHGSLTTGVRKIRGGLLAFALCIPISSYKVTTFSSISFITFKKKCFIKVVFNPALAVCLDLCHATRGHCLHSLLLCILVLPPPLESSIKSPSSMAVFITLSFQCGGPLNKG